MGLKKLTPEKHLGKGMTNQKIFEQFEYAANVPRVNPWTTHAEATVRCSVEDSGEVILAFPSLCYLENENSTPVSLRPPAVTTAEAQSCSPANLARNPSSPEATWGIPSSPKAKSVTSQRHSLPTIHF